jgi:hypothetical protein
MMALVRGETVATILDVIHFVAGLHAEYGEDTDCSGGIFARSKGG